MPNKTTIALTEKQYYEFIETMMTGASFFRPNERICTAMVLEANLGMRIQDILSLTPANFIRDGERYRLKLVTEGKTHKKRPFTVPDEVYAFIMEYCRRYNIGKTDRIFPIGVRTVQKYLAKVADYLGYEDISTHSFRKYYGTEIYRNNGNDIVLVQKLYQHSSPGITMRYIGVYSPQMESALRNHVKLPAGCKKP